MAPPRILIPFTRGASIPDRIREARGIRSVLADHPALQGPLPSYLVTTDQFGQNIDTLEVTHFAALQGGSDRITQRNLADAVVKKNLESYATHAELISGDDMDMLRTFGFPFRKQSQKSIILPNIQPTVTLEHSGSSIITARVVRVTGITSFMFQITEGDPADESGWRLVDAVKNYFIVIKGLHPGTKYWVRACCIGPDGTGPWSLPVSIISL